MKPNQFVPLLTLLKPSINFFNVKFVSKYFHRYYYCTLIYFLGVWVQQPDWASRRGQIRGRSPVGQSDFSERHR
jgi:hypothetical protein